MIAASAGASARTLDHRGLLDAWELCQRHRRDELAVALLELFSGLTAEQCLSLPVGQRDRVLLSAYKRNFSAALEVLDECDDCGEAIEFSLRVDELLSAHDGTMPEKLRIEADGWTIDCAPLHSLAIIRAQHDAIAADDVRSIGKHVVEHLIEGVHRGDKPQTTDDLPQHVFEQVAEGCYAADPFAEISVQPRCPECGLEWTAVIDVTEFVKQRVNTLAQKLLLQIHRLALFYGWGEQAILALTPARRAAYLELTYTEAGR